MFILAQRYSLDIVPLSVRYAQDMQKPNQIHKNQQTKDI